MKRWIAMLLTVCMLISLCPVGVFADSATGGTEPAQTVQTEQSATGATGEEPAAAPENKEEPTPAPEGAKNPPAAPASESNGNAPAEDSGENAPVSEGGKNAPASESNGNVPADNGGATGATGEQNPQPEQKTCTCTKLCAQNAPNTDCEVCKGGDLTGCYRSEASTPDDPEPLPDEQPVEAEPEEPVCTCTARCTAGNVNQTCEACKEDVSKCHASETQPVVDTYEFYVDDILQNDWTQNLQEGEYLSVPGNPAKNGAVFQRWYRLDDAQNRITVKSGAVSGVSGITVRVDAEFAEFSYVLFMSVDGNAVVHTAQGSKGAAVAAGDVSIAENMVTSALNPDEAIVGWSTTRGGTAESIVFGEGTTSVYPVIVEGYWVSFNSDGGDYVAPRFVQRGETVTLPVPGRPGYSFAGWFDESDNQVTTVSSAATLTARWTANKNTEYLVIYWKENADDDGYSYAASEKKTGTTGTSTNASGIEGGYDYFTLSTPIEQKIIAGDGSTIVNVYYKRNTYTLTFRVLYQHFFWEETVVVATITAKYGANISGEFNKEPFTTTYSGRAWKATTNEPYNYALQTLDRMPGTDVKFNLYEQSSYQKKTIYYYVEKVDGNASRTSWPKDNSQFYELKSVQTYFNFATYNEEYHEIEGYTRYDRKTAGFDADNCKKFTKKNTLNLYYLRNSYTLKFINNGSEAKSVSVRYGASLQSQNFTPERPSGIPANYVFAGWYSNQLCQGTPFDFATGTMPAGNMTLYAKWAAPEVTAKVYLTVNVNGENMVLSVPYGSPLKDAPRFEDLMDAIRANNGSEPSAWFSISGDGTRTLFNPDTKLFGDVTLVPHFSGTKETFKVIYKERDEQPGPTDGNQYQDGSYATVMEPVNGNLWFLYWKDEKTGIIYKPGDTLVVTADVTLVAQYTVPLAKAALVYHGVTESYTDSGITGNSYKTVKSVTDVSFTAPAGYTFAGWSTTKGGDAEYFAGNSFFVPKDGAHLYAVWAKRTDLGLTVRYQEEGTGKNLENPVIYYGKTFEEKISVAQYKKDITGYTWVSTTPKDTLTIGVGSNVITLYYKRNTHQVSYRYTGTVPAGAPEAPATTTEKVESAVKVANTPEFAGYVFSGWTAEDVTVDANGFFTMPNHDVTFTGSWSARSDLKYTVRYVWNGQVIESNEVNGQTFGTTATVTPELSATTAADYTLKDTTAKTVPITANNEDNVVTFELRKKVTITVDNASKVFGQNDPAFTGTVSGLVNENDLGTVSYVRTNNAEAVGTYNDVLNAQYTANDNYNVEVKNGNFTITAKSIADLTVDAPTNHEYDGEEHKWAPTVTDGENNVLTEETDYTVGYDKTDFTNVTGTITVTITGMGNYSGTVERTYEITPKTVTIEVDNASKVFGQNDPAFTGTVTGLVDASDLGAVSYVRTNDAEAVGIYNDVLSARYTANDNYNVEVKNGTFTITAKSIANLTVDAPADHVYDGAEHKWAPTVTDKDGNALTENEDYTVSYGKTDFTNVTGDITVTVQGIGNYTGTVTRSYKITPREAVITVNNGTKTAGRNDPAFTGTVTGLIGENDLGVVSYVRTNNAEAVGTYADVLTALYTENANYDVRVINGTFVITAANNPNPNPPQPNPNPPQPNPNPPQPQPEPEPEPEVEPEAGPEVEPEVTPEVEPQPAAPDAGPVEEIVDEETPLAMGGAWALVNLILTVLTVLGSILLLIGYIGKKQKEREDENGNVILNAEGEAETDDIKKKGGWRLASIIPAVAAVIAFILTENMRLPMVLVDKWTLLMVIIALVQLLVAYFSKKKTQEPEQPEQMAANA